MLQGLKDLSAVERSAAVPVERLERLLHAHQKVVLHRTRRSVPEGGPWRSTGAWIFSAVATGTVQRSADA